MTTVTETSRPPRRRLQLDLKLEADSLDDLYSALLCIANDLDHDGREERQVVSGGFRSGHRLILTCDPDQDHERFADQIEAWRVGQLEGE